MAEMLALVHIYNSVKAELVADGVTAEVVFGRREPAKAINKTAGGRICFVPGGLDGKAGRYAPPRDPGRNPAPLMSFREAVEVYCWGYDDTAAEDELAQYVAARTLHDSVVRAITRVMFGTAQGSIEFTNPHWVVNNVERIYGAELVFTLDIPGMIAATSDDEAVPTTYSNTVGFAPTLTGPITVTEVETTS